MNRRGLSRGRQCEDGNGQGRASLSVRLRAKLCAGFQGDDGATRFRPASPARGAAASAKTAMSARFPLHFVAFWTKQSSG